jgi:hypothetical protein
MKINQEHLYSTSDLSLSATISLFIPLWAVNKDNPNQKAEFLFKREQGLDEIIENFWRGELRVDPLKYFLAIKAIKSRLYEKE